MREQLGEAGYRLLIEALGGNVPASTAANVAMTLFSMPPQGAQTHARGRRCPPPLDARPQRSCAASCAMKALSASSRRSNRAAQAAQPPPHSWVSCVRSARAWVRACVRSRGGAGRFTTVRWLGLQRRLMTHDARRDCVRCGVCRRREPGGVLQRACGRGARTPGAASGHCQRLLHRGRRGVDRYDRPPLRPCARTLSCPTVPSRAQTSRGSS